MAETVTAKKQPRRVFQCVGDPNVCHSQLVTFNPTMEEIRNKASRAIAIDRNAAGQFVLRENAAKYDEQLAALRRVCEKYSWLIEIPLEGENKPHPGWQGGIRPQDTLIEGVRRAAERSDVELRLAQSEEKNKSLSEENEYLRDELEQLKKSGKAGK